MLAGDNNGLWREFFEISFEFSIVLFASIHKNTLPRQEHIINRV